MSPIAPNASRSCLEAETGIAEDTLRRAFLALQAHELPDDFDPDEIPQKYLNRLSRFFDHAADDPGPAALAPIHGHLEFLES